MHKMMEVAKLTTADQAAGKYDLMYPIMDVGTKISTLYFRRPNAGDLSTMESAARFSLGDADLFVIARLAGLLPEAARQIDAEDLEGIKEAFKGFFSAAVIRGMDAAKANAMAISAISSGMSGLATGGNG